MSLFGLGSIERVFFTESIPAKLNNPLPNVDLSQSVAIKNDSLNLTVKAKVDSAEVFSRPVKFAPPPPASPDYVKNIGGNFSLNDHTYKFIGTNMYDLANEKSDTTEKMIKDAADHGFTTIRFWAGNASAAKLTEICDAAQKYNVKLLPVLENHYSIPAAENKDDYWYKEGYKKNYLPHLKELVQTSKNRPEIMMWELINEPSTKKFDNIYSFTKDVSAIINSIDKNHLITIGTIGGVVDKFGGELSRVSLGNFKKLYSLPDLDAVSVHDYSYDARVLERLDINARSTGNPDAAKRFNTLDKHFSFLTKKLDKFVLDNFNTTIYTPFSLRGAWNLFNEADIKIAKELQKPVFWGEAGFKKEHGEDRKKLLDNDISKRLSEGVQGYMLWSFEAQGRSIDGHDYGFTEKDGLAPVVKKWNASFTNPVP
jgi:endo-1,4-beta-mannosidase